SFFRDIKPFDHIKEYVLPHFQLYNPDATSMRIWSAACSSGQEPYSLAMTFLDPVVTKMGITAEIIATDIDSTMLEKAQNGLYTQFEVQRGLPVQMLLRYFKQLESYGDKWQISDTLRKMVTFRQKNLIDDFSDMGRFDLIFCRNVLIYFEDGTKQEVLKKLARCLTPHGLLILGSTESLSHLDTPLTPFKNLNGIFCLKGT
ncbi:MAG: protein-glutamate O-methyltransferase CheR, partial [Rickettsiales bacterium]|nr:protein-glutamate O-methyltransferase CheR [Rickettsiales bacterium]